MITCPKCNKELNDGAKFCDGCGTLIGETVFCPSCGKQTNADVAFCHNCGASVKESPVESPDTSASATKKSPKKAIIFGAIGVALVAILVVGVMFFLGGEKEKTEKGQSNYTLYLKDEELWIFDSKKGSTEWQMTSNLIDGDYIDNADKLSSSAFYAQLSSMGENISKFTYMSEDGKYIFFPDKIEDSRVSGFDLYYRNTNGEGDAIKIDSGVTSYAVNKESTIVTYLESEGGGLYQYIIKEDLKEKIASDVDRYMVSDDGNKIGYINSEGSIYLKYADKEKEKIASDVSRLEYVSEDIKTAYYIKDETLYKQVEGQEKVKIASDVHSVLKIYDSGEIYYLTKETLPLANFVTDDMKDADASVTEPEYPDYPNAPSRWSYSTEVEYDAAYEAYKKEYERLSSEYQAAVEAYKAKSFRDGIREALNDDDYELAYLTLYFYDGAEKTVVTDSCYYYSDIASESPVIAYVAYEETSFEKIKLSEIDDSVDSAYDIYSLVKEMAFSAYNPYVAVKSTPTLIEQEKKAGAFLINASGTEVYYIDNIPDGKDYGELYKISISKGVVSKPEVYDSDVYCRSGVRSYFFANNDKLVYYKDVKNGKGELYINKKRIDYDVRIYDIVQTDAEEMFYFTDWNSEKQCGTLKIYRQDKPQKIKDDVYGYSVTADGRVLYLYDYSLNYYKGELHEWANGETRKIDDDVVLMIPVTGGKYRGISMNNE